VENDMWLEMVIMVIAFLLGAIAQTVFVLWLAKKEREYVD